MTAPSCAMAVKSVKRNYFIFIAIRPVRRTLTKHIRRTDFKGMATPGTSGASHACKTHAPKYEKHAGAKTYQQHYDHARTTACDDKEISKKIETNRSRQHQRRRVNIKPLRLGLSLWRKNFLRRQSIVDADAD